MFARRLFGLSATATVILGAAVWIAAPVYSVEHADSPKTAVKNAAEPPRFKPADIAFFKKKVKPLLEARCFKCHGPKSKKLKGGLRLDSRAAVLKGGETGPAAVPGKPKKSLLIEAINYDDLEMPPRTKLPKGEIAILTKWVQMGMPFSKRPQAPGVSRTPGAFPLEERKRSHWAWQPARKRSLPKVKNEKWAVTAIDRFILAKLEAKDIAPAAPADRRTLIRRAYFDLIGLPPTPADVAAFVDDSQPTRTAFATVVDRLLKSPRFGERWGRHWLDLVRYADTLGHEFDYPLRHAHQYRDYVIRAFNADVPYDRFVTEHIAGDLMPDPRRHPELGYNESVIGTGFWFLGEDKHSPVDVKGEEASKIDNQLDVFSKTFLGLTVACARCHDHKFDAITTKDYYALSGFLQSSRRDTALLDPRGVIGHGTRRLRKLLQQANQKLRGNLTDSSKKRAADVAGMLLASQRVLRGKAGKRPEVLKRAATAYGVEERRLATFVRALESKDVDRTAHPLWAWKQLVATRDRHLPKRIAALRQRFERADASFRSTRDKSKPFADFNGRDFGGWMATGFAFGNAPTQPLEWDPASKQTNHLVRAGVAHSGRFSGRLAGVLRSPTFTLTHDQILYRVRGRGRIRLIIDGYVMDEFNGLLFQGASMKVNTRGRWRWLRQGGDIHRYKGHRAHIEIIDDGHDWIAVDEVRFADRRDPTPPAQPHAVALQLLKDPAVTSLKSLAARLAAILTDPQQPAGAKRSAAPAIADREALLNAALQSGLLTIPKNGLQKLAGEMRKTAAGIPDPMRVIAITDGSPEDEHVFIRGNHKTPGPVVPRRMLEAVSGSNQAAIKTGSGRLELARRMLDPSNPFPARVMVNRIWHHLTGKGIVASVDNFGVLGQRPTHPELLDHLASTFIADGWSIKRMIRRVMLSNTYMMSSTPNPSAEKADPQNLLLHRMRIRRLQGEAIRDAMLAVSHRLDTTMYGPPVPVYLTRFMQGRGRPRRSGPLDGNGRRSIYIAVRRNFLSPMMIAFDTPIPFNAIGRRNVSNVPAQALILMNDPFVVGQAQVWAKRVLAEKAADPTDRIRRMYEAAYSREPTGDELANGVAFLKTQTQSLGLKAGDWKTNPQVWGDFAHVLFNVKEFIYLR